jgi:hypothetical protein
MSSATSSMARSAVGAHQQPEGVEGVEDEVRIELGAQRLRLRLGAEHGFAGGERVALVHPPDRLGPHEESVQDGVQEEAANDAEEKHPHGAGGSAGGLVPPHEPHEERHPHRSRDREGEPHRRVGEEGPCQAALRAQQVPPAPRQDHGETRGGERVRQRHAERCRHPHPLLAQGGGDIQPRVGHPGRGEDGPEPAVAQGGPGGRRSGAAVAHPVISP